MFIQTNDTVLVLLRLRLELRVRLRYLIRLDLAPRRLPLRHLPAIILDGAHRLHLLLRHGALLVLMDILF